MELASTPSVSVTDSASIADPSSRIVEECSSVAEATREETETSEETERVATDVLQASISEQDKKDPHEVLGKFVNGWKCWTGTTLLMPGLI